MTKKDVIKIIAILLGLRITGGIIYKILYSIKRNNEEKIMNERRAKERIREEKYFDDMMNQIRSNMETNT